MARWDELWVGAGLLTMGSGGSGLGEIPEGALAVLDGRIAWVGAARDLPGPAGELAARVRTLRRGWITPGLVDCHTHLVYAGHRAGEFESRLGGAGYEDIARAGGGILATVRATRAADTETLLAAAARRARRLLDEGVTTIEVKSGYGLDEPTELRLLDVATRLGALVPVRVHRTLLAAHAVPPEFSGRPDDYVASIADVLLPESARRTLVDSVDVFVDRPAFTADQGDRILSAARRLGLPVRVHADQLSDAGGARLAARHHALSADHLEHVSEEGVAALAESGTVAVLLPGAWYFLGAAGRRPPVEAFRRHGVLMAVATDSNPGTSPTTSLLLMLSMACVLFGLTPDEALSGVTRHAARAVGLADEIGALTVGRRADLAVWDVDHPRELCYWLGANPCVGAVTGGRLVVDRLERLEAS